MFFKAKIAKMPFTHHIISVNVFFMHLISESLIAYAFEEIEKFVLKVPKSFFSESSWQHAVGVSCSIAPTESRL